MSGERTLRAALVAKVVEVVGHRRFNSIFELQGDRRAVLEAADNHCSRYFVVGTEEPIGQLLFFLLEEPDILLELAIDEVASKMHGWIGGRRISHDDLAKREVGVPVCGPIGCVLLALDIFCEEERLAASIDIAEMLDPLAVVVVQAQPILRADDFDAVGAVDQVYHLVVRNDFCFIEHVSDQDHGVDVVTKVRVLGTGVGIV